jgi:hypothetical protein
MRHQAHEENSLYSNEPLVQVPQAFFQQYMTENLRHPKTSQAYGSNRQNLLSRDQSLENEQSISQLKPSLMNKFFD